MKINRQHLISLQKKLEIERGRLLADHGMMTASERLPARLIRELAEIDFAAHAIAAELTQHSPRLGYGSET